MIDALEEDAHETDKIDGGTRALRWQINGAVEPALDDDVQEGVGVVQLGC